MRSKDRHAYECAIYRDFITYYHELPQQSNLVIYFIITYV